MTSPIGWKKSKIVGQVRKWLPKASLGLSGARVTKTTPKSTTALSSVGTGAPGSEESQQIRWFMNKDFRLALLRDVNGNGREEVIDLTAGPMN